MKPSVVMFVAVLAASLFFTSPARAQGCPSDSVRIARMCVDTYEASVWDLSAVGVVKPQLIRRIRAGTVTENQLNLAGAVQRGVSMDDYPCDDNGDDCTEIYAVSIDEVMPSAFITWFQAQQAAANSGKRLLTNAEWQMAAAGTPDPGLSQVGSEECNTNAGALDGSDAVVETGTRTDCFSRFGAFDMVGNLWEWVADWVPRSEGCSPNPLYPGSLNCFDGADTDGPGALIRGGDFSNAFAGGSSAGVFAVYGRTRPNESGNDKGFRAVR